MEAEYIERQYKWIQDNNIQVDSLVQVMFVAEDFENGWLNNWSPLMDEATGKIFTVSTTDEEGWGIKLDDGYYYPYFVLKPIENNKTVNNIKLELPL